MYGKSDRESAEILLANLANVLHVAADGARLGEIASSMAAFEGPFLPVNQRGSGRLCDDLPADFGPMVDKRCYFVQSR